MADRFPLIVNSVSRKIEELLAGDNLDLTNNNIRASGSLGQAGQYLKSDGSVVLWDTPGDVYLTATQTITNKTIESSFLSGVTNTFAAIPNTALDNSSITVNGTAIALGGSVTTPNDNTTYSISCTDGATDEKIIRLTAGGSGSGDDDVSIAVAPYAGTLPANHKVANLYIDRTGDQISLSASAEDIDTITRVAAAGGSFTTGDVTIAAGNFTTVTQLGGTITIAGENDDTITRVTENVSGAGNLVSGDITLASGSSNLTIAQVGTTFTFNSVDTITRLRATGPNGGTLVSGDVLLEPGTNIDLTQNGNSITITSSFTNTITQIRGTTSGTFVTGDVTLAQGGATTITQGTGASSDTITISSQDTNTTFSPRSNGGLVISGTADVGAPNGTEFSIKNIDNLSNNRVVKFDTGNRQFTNTIIDDDGSTVTINGNLSITGSQTVIETQTLSIEDNIIELRRGNNIASDDGGIQVNLSTNGSGTVTDYRQLAWYDVGGYWRTYDGSLSHQIVTDDEVQTLTNKTLTAPVLVSPNIGSATATLINGLTINQTVGSTLSIANNKTFTCNNTLTFQGSDNSTVSFGSGGSVIYTSNRIDALALTTSSQLAGKISDETGGGGKLVFNLNPVIQQSIGTQDASFDLLDTSAALINFGGDCTTMHIGSGRPTTPATPINTIRTFDAMTVQVDGNAIINDSSTGTLLVNGIATFANNDITVQGIDIGRGNNDLQTNVAVGEDALGTCTSGTQNTAIGHQAGITIKASAANTLVGTRAAFSTSVGGNNVAVGRDSLYTNASGSKNVSIGTNAGYNSTGDANVYIGHFAGNNCTGNGNVVIGPATDENGTNTTWAPLIPSGDRQLVIGSGTGFWMRGDINYDITFPNSVVVGDDMTVNGSLTVNGLVTTLNTNTLDVDDKNIIMGSIEQSLGWTATVTVGSNQAVSVSSFDNLIEGVEVTIITGGVTFADGTTAGKITSIDNATGQITFDKNISGSSGSCTFNALGATNSTADGGGIIIKGQTDKSFTYTEATNTFTSSEGIDLAANKSYKIANTQIANGQTQTIGPTSGSWTLGAGVTSSSLTSVGTLTGLTQTGQYNIGSFNSSDGINMGDTGYFQLRSDSRSDTSQAISVYKNGTTGTALKAAIYHGGGALFKDSVTIDGDLTVDDLTVTQAATGVSGVGTSTVSNVVKVGARYRVNLYQTTNPNTNSTWYLHIARNGTNRASGTVEILQHGELGGQQSGNGANYYKALWSSFNYIGIDGSLSSVITDNVDAGGNTSIGITGVTVSQSDEEIIYTINSQWYGAIDVIIEWMGGNIQYSLDETSTTVF